VVVLTLLTDTPGNAPGGFFRPMLRVTCQNAVNATYTLTGTANFETGDDLQECASACANWPNGCAGFNFRPQMSEARLCELIGGGGCNTFGELVTSRFDPDDQFEFGYYHRTTETLSPTPDPASPPPPSVSPTIACGCNTSTWTNLKQAQSSDNQYHDLLCGECTAFADLGGDGGQGGGGQGGGNGLRTCRQWCATQQGGLGCSRAWEDGSNNCVARPSMEVVPNWKCATPGGTPGDCQANGVRDGVDFSDGVDWGCDFDFSRSAGNRQIGAGDPFDFDFNGGDAICECEFESSGITGNDCGSTVQLPRVCAPVAHYNTSGNTACNGYGGMSVGYCEVGYWKSQGTGPFGSDECVLCSPPCGSTEYESTICNDWSDYNPSYPYFTMSEWTRDRVCTACTEQPNCAVPGDACATTRPTVQDELEHWRTCDQADAGFYVDRVVNLSLACPDRLGPGCDSCESVANSSVACGETGCFEIPACPSCSGGNVRFPTATLWISHATSWSYMCRSPADMTSCEKLNVSTAEDLKDAVESAPTDGRKRRVYLLADIALGALCNTGVSRRTPIGVTRCRSSLRSARTVLENTILTAVSTVVLTGVVYTSEVVQWV